MGHIAYCFGLPVEKCFAEAFTTLTVGLCTSAKYLGLLDSRQSGPHPKPVMLNLFQHPYALPRDAATA